MQISGVLHVMSADAGGLTLMWGGLLMGLTGLFHLLMVLAPGRVRMRRQIFRQADGWFLRLVRGDMGMSSTLCLVVLMTLPGLALSELLLSGVFAPVGLVLQCLLLVFAGGCLFNAARRAGEGKTVLRPLMAFLISLLVIRGCWLLLHNLLA